MEEIFVASTIFVIDSSPAVRRMVEQISLPEGHDVIGFQDGPAALEAARTQSPDLIITDYHLENMTFSGFCKEVQKLDNLADTYIIALTGTTDKLDESHLKSLGVKAFLKKPFQSENLLDLIKDLDRTAAAPNSNKKKARTWPPTTSATDSDDDTLSDVPVDGPPDDAPAVNITIPYPAAKTDSVVANTSPVTAAMPSEANKPVTEPEDAIKGLFGKLLQTLSEKTEKRIDELLPNMVSTKLAALIARVVETEVDRRLAEKLTQERLTRVIEPLLAQELSKVLKSNLAVIEPIIRAGIFEIADPIIKDAVERVVLEQSERAQSSLPDMIRDRLRGVETQVQEEIKETVRKLIPTIAEEQIKAEIARLTEAA